MKTKTKALALALCAVLLVVTTVFVTMAYLTATTDTVKNTFTVGNVTLKGDSGYGLDEAKVDVYGNEIENAGRVTSNKYKLIPGHTYTKDPTVHVADNSETCYLFVQVKNGLKDIIADKTIENQMVELGWICIDETNGIWAYATTVENVVKMTAVDGGADKVVFNEFTLADDADVSAYEDAEITITAYAVQADGFENESAATIWNTAFVN